MTDEKTIDIDGETYVLRHDGEGLQVGRRIDGDVTWLDTVADSLLPEAARSALSSGDTSDEALQTAVRGVLEAEVKRGG
ncbi:hypothetical protein JKP75_03790 [Blastococcus sp. TML/M2B]|uniref:hypothetical protein n=1 Tax=unclassified Blastococcus TaxID=2619396 RepID=UPI0019095551|nr:MULTISPECIES: hypothetical protein [unclassified Blastococcus]MBN1091771.1 hypothetical protein [Blastococcus sp. TML/M2B]MBN1094673.1 hypothetical protein [Blastococcus sp. TML/C7B]